VFELPSAAATGSIAFVPAATSGANRAVPVPVTSSTPPLPPGLTGPNLTVHPLAALRTQPGRLSSATIVLSIGSQAA